MNILQQDSLFPKLDMHGGCEQKVSWFFIAPFEEVSVLKKYPQSKE